MTDIQEPKISPELYKQTLRGLSLRRVSLDQLTATCSRDAVETGEITVDVGYEAKAEQTRTNYFAFITYALKSECADKPFLSIEATYRVTFDANSPVPEGFFEIFEHLNLRLTTVPYFRELVASTTGRMELPTLTLPYELPTLKATKQSSVGSSSRQKSKGKKSAAT